MISVRSLFDFASVAAPKAVGGACLIALNIWLMRLLPTELFGVYTLSAALLVLLSEGLLGAALDMGVLRLSSLYLEHQPERAIGIERAALRLKLQVIGSLAGVLCIAAGPLGRMLFHRTGEGHLLVLVSVGSIAALTLASALLHLQIRSRFRLYGALDALHIILKFGGIVSVLLIYRDSQSLISAASVLVWFVLGPAIAVGAFWLASNGSLFRLRGWRGAETRELIAQVKWIFATLLVSSLVSKLDVLLLALLGNMNQLGVYAGGQTIASVPLLIGSYLGIVLNPKVMPFCRSGRFFKLLRDVQFPLFAICVVVYSLVFLLQGTLKDKFMPVQFQASADIILILLPATLAGMTSFPLAIAFLMFVAPRALIGLECLLLPGLVIAYVVVIPEYGAWGAAIITSTFGLIKTLAAQWLAFKLARRTPTEMGLDTRLVTDNPAPFG